MPEQQLTAAQSWGDGRGLDTKLAVEFYDHELPRRLCASARDLRRLMQKGEFLRASREPVQHLESRGDTVERLCGRDQRRWSALTPGSQDVAA
jgi:hypothetical protein